MPAELKLILEGLAIISDKTCVKFKPFKGETSFVQISLGTQYVIRTIEDASENLKADISHIRTNLNSLVSCF